MSNVKIARSLINLTIIVWFVVAVGSFVLAFLEVNFDTSVSVVPGLNVIGLDTNETIQQNLTLNRAIFWIFSTSVYLPLVLFVRSKLDDIVKTGKIFSDKDKRKLEVSMIASLCIWLFSTLISPLLYSLYVIDLSSSAELISRTELYELNVNFVPIVIIKISHIFLLAVFLEGNKLYNETKEII